MKLLGKRKRRTSLVGRLFRTTLTAAAGWIAFSNLGIDHEMDLDPALEAQRHILDSFEAGKLSYYASPAGKGRPLVLIHSVNAAASAYEMRPLFDHYRGSRPVYALDLPGFGFSERGQRDYRPQLYEHAILDFLQQVVKTPADVVALSLGCEFVARAAVHYPGFFHSLALISPSGLSASGSGSRSQQAGKTDLGEALYRGFSVKLWARPLFDLLATRPSIRYFLQKSFVGEVPDALIDYAYHSAHQPGAEFAPLNFISGKLFTSQVLARFYTALTRPTLIIHDRDAYTGFEALPDLLHQNKKVQAVRIVPTLGLPHWEQPGQTSTALGEFWKKAA